MELTTQQIQDLYTFTRQHYVEHYDVQTELVDHLANDIEHMQKENKSLTFEQAMNKSFKKFGVFGFSEIVSKRESALSKKYNKILWQFVKKWFQLPKIFATITIFFIFYILFSLSFGINIIYGLFWCFLVYTLYKFYMLRKQQKIRFQKTNKKWMLEEKIFITAGANMCLLSLNVINLVNVLDIFSHSIIFTFIICLFFTLSIICTYIVMEVIPKQAERLLAEYYPEYQIV